MEINTEKTGRALAVLLQSSPFAVSVLAVIGSFTFLMWKVPDARGFFLTLVDQEHRSILALGLVLLACEIAHLRSQRRLEAENFTWEFEHDVCRLEQTLMRTALFEVGLMAASTPQEKLGVQTIIDKLDRKLELVPDQARMLVERRNGSEPVPGGRRRYDPKPSRS